MQPTPASLRSAPMGFGAIAEAILGPAPLLAIEERRNAVLAVLSSVNPHAAISVWHPRTAPFARGSARLLAYNAEFLRATDSTLPAWTHELYGAEAPVEDEQLRDVLNEALEQLSAAFDAMHQGRVTEVCGVSLHASPSGRLQYVWLTLVPLFDHVDGALLEWICAMTPLPALIAPQLALHSTPGPELTHRSAPDTSHSPQLSPACTAEADATPLRAWRPQRSRVPHTFVLAPHAAPPAWEQVCTDKLMRKRPRSQDSTFSCAECGATETPQRRYAQLYLAH